MFKRLSTDAINTLLIIGVILLIIEVVFFNGGLVFSVLFSSLLIYIGWKKYYVFWRKILFWIGAVSLMLTVLSMIAVRFLILAVLLLFIHNYYKSKKEPEQLKPEIINTNEEIPYNEPLLAQKFFGDQSTPNQSYKWQDVNIHGGFGDRIIDLSQTVLPHDEAVISIRHLAGNIFVYVPYEVEVSIQHSAVIGRAAIFQHKKTKVLNQYVSFRTSDYTAAKPRVKIITSIFSGDLEVKRI